MRLRAACSFLAALALAAVPASAHGATASSWAQSGADASMSNDNPSESALTSATVHGLRPQYGLAKVAHYGECGGSAFGSDLPVSDGTSLYWFDGLRVRAVNLRSGAPVWKSPVLDSFGGTYVRQIAVSGGRVVVIASNCTRVSQPEGGIVAYSSSTGRVVWRTPGSTEPNPISIAIAGNRLLVSGYDGDESAETWSYDVTTGAAQWHNTDCAQSSYQNGIFTVAGIIPEDLCQDAGGTTVGSGGLVLGTGLTSWFKDYGYSYTRGDVPAVATPHAYLTDKTGHIVSMRPDGTRAWRAGAETGTVLAAGPANVYTDCGTTDSICALDPDTGARHWKVPVGSNDAGVAVAADVLYPYLLNAVTGAALVADSQVSPTGRSGVAAGHLWTENGQVVQVYGLP